MRRKIISGFLALALVFTSVPTDVYARGTGGITTDREKNVINTSLEDLLNSNNDGDKNSTGSIEANSSNDQTNSGTSTIGGSLSDLLGSNSNSSGDVSNDTQNDVTNNENDTDSKDENSSSNSSSSSSSSSLADLLNSLSSSNNTDNTDADDKNDNVVEDNSSNSNSGIDSTAGSLDNLLNSNNATNNDTDDTNDNVVEDNSSNNSSGSDGTVGSLDHLLNSNNSADEDETTDEESNDTSDDTTDDESADSSDVTTENNSSTSNSAGGTLADLLGGVDSSDSDTSTQDDVLNSDDELTEDIPSMISSNTDTDYGISTITSGETFDGIILKIDTTNLGYSSLRINDVTLSNGVTAEVIEPAESSSSGISAISSFFQKFNIFNPMSINYVSTAKIVEAINTNLISGTVGYVGVDGDGKTGDISKLSDVTATSYLRFHIPSNSSNTYTYDKNKTGIANFAEGYMPVFDPASDFSNASGVVLTGWKFSDGTATINSNTEYGVQNISGMNYLSINSLSDGDEITIPDMTFVEAIFSVPVTVGGYVGYTGSSSNFDYTTLTATLYDQNGNKIESAKLTVADNGQGFYEFDNLSQNTSYEVVITGSTIEEKSYSFGTGNSTYITNGTIYVSDKQYSVTYYDYYNGSLSGVTKKYELGGKVDITISNSYKEYLTENNLTFDSWEFYDVNGKEYTNFTTTLETDRAVSFIMPSYDVVVLYVTQDAINGYTVYFYDAGVGSIIETQSGLELGETLDYVTPSDRFGYTFTGWYTTSAFTTEWDFDTELTASHFNSNEEKTLYAGWEGDDINVVINYNNSSSNSGQLSKMKVGQTRTISAGSRPGSSFSNWSWTNDSIYNKSYAMSSYVTPNTETSTISFEVPPLEEGSTLTITANWDPLYAYVYVDGIVNGNAAGNSVTVSIYNSDYGTIYGEFVGFNSDGDEYYVFNLQDYGTGMFTVDVVSKTSDQEMSSIIYVEDDEFNHVYVELLPEGKTASVTNSSSVDNVGSNNLKDQFTTADLNSSNDVSIDMVVADVPANSADANYILQSIGSNQTIGLFIDVSLLKNDGTNVSSIQPVASKGLNVTVELPDSFKNQKSYFVSTVHDNMYSQLSSSSVSYDADSNSISFYTKNLSVFGIGYSGTSSSSAYTGYNIPTADGYYVPLFQNVIVGQWIQGLGKYQLVHPDSANWKFAGWYYGSTGLPLSQYELDNYFVVTQNMITYGIYPRFVQVDEYGNPLTTPVPSTGAFDTIITHDLIALI